MARLLCLLFSERVDFTCAIINISFGDMPSSRTQQKKELVGTPSGCVSRSIQTQHSRGVRPFLPVGHAPTRPISKIFKLVKLEKRVTALLTMQTNVNIGYGGVAVASHSPEVSAFG